MFVSHGQTSSLWLCENLGKLFLPNLPVNVHSWRVLEDLRALFLKANLLVVTKPNKAIQPSGRTPRYDSAVGERGKPACP